MTGGNFHLSLGRAAIGVREGCNRMRWRPRGITALMPAAKAAMLALPLMLQSCHRPDEIAGTYEAIYGQQMAARDYGGALQSIQKAVTYDENQPRLWLGLARVQAVLNMPAGAAASYQRALDLDPVNIEALEALSVLSVRTGQFDLAKRYIEQLMLLQPNNGNGMLASGIVALHEHRYDEAERIAASLVAGAPDSPGGYVLRARKLDMTGHSKEAAALIEQRVRLDPRNVELLLELMTLYRNAGDRSGVRATALRLMPLVPGDPRYALEGARVYHATGHDDAARKTLADLATRFGNDVSVMLAVARMWSEMEPPAQAHDRIAAAAAAAPPRVRAALADLLTGMGDPARAVALLAPFASGEAAAANLDTKGVYARALLAAGRKDAAVSVIDEVLALDPTNPTCLLLRARLALARGDYLAAATDAQLAASTDGTNEEAAVLAAQIYSAQGNQLLAGNAFAQARGKFRDSANVLRAEGQWLLGQKRTADAVRRSSEYVEAHRDQSAGWVVYRDICTAAHDAACLAAARRGLARFS